MFTDTTNERLRVNVLSAVRAHEVDDTREVYAALERMDSERSEEARRELAKIQPELVHLDTRVAKEAERLIRTIYGGRV